MNSLNNKVWFDEVLDITAINLKKYIVVLESHDADENFLKRLENNIEMLNWAKDVLNAAESIAFYISKYGCCEHIDWLEEPDSFGYREMYLNKASLVDFDSDIDISFSITEAITDLMCELPEFDYDELYLSEHTETWWKLPKNVIENKLKDMSEFNHLPARKSFKEKVWFDEVIDKTCSNIREIFQIMQSMKIADDISLNMMINNVYMLEWAKDVAYASLGIAAVCGKITANENIEWSISPEDELFINKCLNKASQIDFASPEKDFNYFQVLDIASLELISELSDYTNRFRDYLLENEDMSWWKIEDEVFLEFFDNFLGTEYSTLYKENLNERINNINEKSKHSKSFIDDQDKMIDFFTISKNDFLAFYSYLTEEDYIDTCKDVLERCKYWNADGYDYEGFAEGPKLKLIVESIAMQNFLLNKEERKIENNREELTI